MAYWDRPYMSAAERRARAAAAAQRLGGKGHVLAPVRARGRKLAATFWGRAWCQNLEVYSDYANRLPRGRTYARNGSILDLQVSGGRVEATVSGSALYSVAVRIHPLAAERWASIQASCAGQIDSLIELLQGQLSASVMAVVTDPETGLFPSPRELAFDCTCPDWASMCKHVAATLYGVGVRLDEAPELLFELRGVEPDGMISLPAVGAAPSRGVRLEGVDLASIFGVDIDFDLDAAIAPESLDDRILACLRSEPGLGIAALTERLGAPRPAVGKALARSKRAGRIEFRGPRRTGGYHLRGRDDD